MKILNFQCKLTLGIQIHVYVYICHFLFSGKQCVSKMISLTNQADPVVLPSSTKPVKLLATHGDNSATSSGTLTSPSNVQELQSHLKPGSNTSQTIQTLESLCQSALAQANNPNSSNANDRTAIHQVTSKCHKTSLALVGNTDESVKKTMKVIDATASDISDSSNLSDSHTQSIVKNFPIVQQVSLHSPTSDHSNTQIVVQVAAGQIQQLGGLEASTLAGSVQHNNLQSLSKGRKSATEKSTRVILPEMDDARSGHSTESNTSADVMKTSTLSITEIKKSFEYAFLRERFISIFYWPALLATVDPPQVK